MNWLNKIAIRAIKFYQLIFSRWLGGHCKFVPSCSNYGLEAFQRHNFFRAMALVLWRILRCNPFVRGGYDPVPGSKKSGQETEI